MFLLLYIYIYNDIHIACAIRLDIIYALMDINIYCVYCKNCVKCTRDVNCENIKIIMMDIMPYIYSYNNIGIYNKISSFVHTIYMQIGTTGYNTKNIYLSTHTYIYIYIQFSSDMSSLRQIVLFVRRGMLNNAIEFYGASGIGLTPLSVTETTAKLYSSSAVSNETQF